MQQWDSLIGAAREANGATRDQMARLVKAIFRESRHLVARRAIKH
jgi:hypothetical protein